MMPKTATATVIASLLAMGCAQSPSVELEANKELVGHFTEATNAADWDALAEIVAEDFTRHSAATAGPPVASRDEFVQLQESFLLSFPDQHVSIQRMIAEGDYVAARATYTGTQTGPMGEFPATGRTVEAPFMAMFRIEKGQVAELWVEWDNLAMLTQLGLFPPAEPVEGTTDAAPLGYHRLGPAELPTESFSRPPEVPPDPTSNLHRLENLTSFYDAPGELGFVMRGHQYGFDALSIIVTETHPHGGPPLHTHDVEEAHIVLSGTMDYVMNGQRFRAVAPYIARVPPGIAHTFINGGEGPLNLVAVFPSDNHVTEVIGPNPLVGMKP